MLMHASLVMHMKTYHTSHKQDQIRDMTFIAVSELPPYLDPRQEFTALLLHIKTLAVNDYKVKLYRLCLSPFLRAFALKQ